MPQFYERYQQRFHQEVYDELLDLGEEVYTEPYYDEAQLVAKALMQRVRQNISLLVSRLPVLGYRFGEGMWGEEDEISLEEKLLFEQDMPIFRFPTTETSLLVEELEQLVGTLPLSLFHWYKEVGCVNLVGLFPSKGEQKFGQMSGMWYPRQGELKP